MYGLMNSYQSVSGLYKIFESTFVWKNSDCENPDGYLPPPKY